MGNQLCSMKNLSVSIFCRSIYALPDASGFKYKNTGS